MRGECINSIFGRKSVTGKEFSDIDFLYNVKILAARRWFLHIFSFLQRVRRFNNITTSGLKYDVIFKIGQSVFR